jgi:CRP-like cAMP-binding protein
MRSLATAPAVTMSSDLSADAALPIQSALTRKLSILCDMSDEALLELDLLVDDSEWVRPGGLIAPEKCRPSEAIVLLDGWACRCADFRDGRRQLIAVLIAGDIVYEGGRRQRANHAARALTRVKVARVSHDRLAAVVERHPCVSEAFWVAADIDGAILRSWLVNLGQRNARERMAHLFCELAARLNDGVLPPSANFNLPLTQLELACALGLTTVHVNRVLQRLRAEGLVSLTDRVMTIPNVGQLSAVAGFDPAYLLA